LTSKQQTRGQEYLKMILIERESILTLMIVLVNIRFIILTGPEHEDILCQVLEKHGGFMTRLEVVKAICDGCDGDNVSELTKFGSDVSRWHPAIINVERITGVKLLPKEVAKRTVGAIANKVMDRLPN
jgi:hypothetical protein